MFREVNDYTHTFFEPACGFAEHVRTVCGNIYCATSVPPKHHSKGLTPHSQGVNPHIVANGDNRLMERGGG